MGCEYNFMLTLTIEFSFLNCLLYTSLLIMCFCGSLCPGRNSDKGVEIAYLGTRTGLSRFNLFVTPDQLTNQLAIYIFHGRVHIAV